MKKEKIKETKDEEKYKELEGQDGIKGEEEKYEAQQQKGKKKD